MNWLTEDIGISRVLLIALALGSLSGALANFANAAEHRPPELHCDGDVYPVNWRQDSAHCWVEWNDVTPE